MLLGLSESVRAAARRRRHALRAALCAAALWSACAAQPPAQPPPGSPAPPPAAVPVAAAAPGDVVPPEGLLAPHDGPTLFLSAAPDAPAIGYTAADLLVQPAEPPEGGRVLVRIDGPMRVRAYAPVELVTRKVQRRGGIRGAPVYVSPGDRVHVVGPAEEPGRLAVVARARIGDGWSDAFAGTFPEVGIANQDPPPSAEPPPAGEAHVLPPGVALTLYDEPGGSAVAGLPPRQQPVAVDVLRSGRGWHAVRVGDGPYLIGYTQAPIAPGTAPPPEPPSEPPSGGGPVPERIEREAGTLKRVRSGAKLRFNGQIIAVLKTDGWARVLAEYPEGQVDVFAAADDSVAVRGLVDASALYDPQ